MQPTSWDLDYTTSSTPSSLLLDPPGFVPATRSSLKTNTSSTSSSSSLAKKQNLDALRQQKAWEVALAPGKSVPMQGFMMYMTGNSVQIFSVMSVWSCLKGAVSGMMSVDKAFAQFSTTTKPNPVTPSTANMAPPPSYLLQKATFLACQIGLLLVGLWKMNALGLLPTHDSDWLAWRPLPDFESDLTTCVSAGLCKL